jgi:uncharacterized protein YfaP (DUF2135 family)
LNESFNNIFEDAEHNFTSNNQPRIVISSHTNGQTVVDRNIELIGVVESSEVLISQIDVFVENQKFSTQVDTNGNFAIGISLNTGTNILRFVTKGMVNGVLSEVTPNNMDLSPFAINVGLEKSAILVTLTWDKYDTDVDLYVIDPLGDYSYYSHMTTADGGELDYDNTEGYGPEHWTLSSNDTIRWNQDFYRIRVHYYDDNGNGGTNYALTVKLYEGTADEKVYTQTGYLAISDYSNDSPLGTGSDWADFNIPITLTGFTTASFFRELNILPPINSIKLSVDVEPASIRKLKKQK